MKPWETLGMNVHDMAADWDPIWRPPDNAGARPADAWRAFAEDHLQPRSTVDPLWLPPLEDFTHATSQSTGSAGFDGWDSHEAYEQQVRDTLGALTPHRCCERDANAQLRSIPP
jgi:hypothetical protein